MEDNSKNIVCLEEVRRCTKCEAEKPKTKEYFYARNNKLTNGEIRQDFETCCKMCSDTARNDRRKGIKKEKIIKETKPCSICKIEKPKTTEYFYIRNKKMSNGETRQYLQSYCIDCACRKIDSNDIETLVNDSQLECFNENRICIDCGIEKPKTKEHFKFNKSTSCGKIRYYFSKTCTECQSIKTKKYKQENKDKIEAYNKGRGKELAKIRNDKLKEKIAAHLVLEKENWNGMRVCTDCQIEKPETEEFFYIQTRKMRDGTPKQYFDIYCSDCQRRRAIEYRATYPEKIKAYNESETVKESKKEYSKRRKANMTKEEKAKQKEKEQQYYLENKEKFTIRTKTIEYKNKKREYKKKKRKEDGFFKMRDNVSNRVNKALKSIDGSKNGNSTFQYIGYTTQQLKQWITKQFTSEMNWDNYGSYWHLDHIIPHSLFEYDTMDCQAFRDCWALANLRPLEAKQNIADGVNRIRHKLYKEALDKRKEDTKITIGEIIEKMEMIVKNAENEENKE